MPEASKSDLVFNKQTHIITVPIAFDLVTVQTLIDASREFESSIDNIDALVVIDASGKNDLGAGEFVGITCRLVNDWRLEFAARSGPTTEPMIVSQGNLIATNTFDDNPIFPSAFTQVQIRQSTAPSGLVLDSTGTPDDFVEALKTEDFQGESFEDRIVGTDDNTDALIQGQSDICEKVEAVDAKLDDLECSPGGGGGGATSGCLGPGSILVNQDYGGDGCLAYHLNGAYIDNADISVFLLTDYLAGNRGVDHLVAFTRTMVDGTWQVALMLDPQQYAFVYSKQGVAGPDVFSVTVAEDSDDIVITRIDVPAAVPPPPACPEPEVIVQEVQTTTGLDEFGGTGQVLVDHDYGGVDALQYLVQGQPVAGVEILIFPAADYNAGRKQNSDSVAASRTRADGRWEQSVKVDPGQYVIQFFKQNVAGPDAFPLTVQL